MRDETTTLAELKEVVRAFNEAREWGQFHNPRNLAMCLSVEAGELLDLFLWSRDEGPQPPVEGRRQAVEEELADVAWNLVNLADSLGVDLAAAFAAKAAKNEQKYPVERSRGRLEKAAELAAMAAEGEP
jgi:NTP pyrophosphatase (non-canonical NTP hydrolase)